MSDIATPNADTQSQVEPNDALNRIKMFTQRFEIAEASLGPKRNKWKLIDIYDRGEQWKDLNIPPWVPKPITNYIRYIRTLKRANLASSIPMAHYTALEQQFAQFMERLQKAYEHVWEWEKIPRTIRWSIDRGLLRGTSIVYVYNDDMYTGGAYSEKGNVKNRLYKGKICVKPWSLTNFFPDPDATCIRECKWIDTTELVPLRSVKNNADFRAYCKKKGTLDKLKALTGTQLESSDNANGTIFNRDWKPEQTSETTSKDYMATVHAHWERYMKETGQYQLDVTYYLRNTDFELLRIENVKPNCYPFAVYLDEQEDMDFFGTSTLMELLENQKIINKTGQTYSIIATMHQNPQKVVTRSSGINAQEVAVTGTLPGKTWTTNDVDPSKSVYNVQPPEIPRSLFEVDRSMKEDIKEISGVNEAYTGQSVGSLTTSSGVRSLIERASIRDKDKMKQIDAFVEDISDLIVKFIMYKWKEERPITRRLPNGKADYSTYEPIEEDIADQLEWLCTVDTYAVAPTTEEARKQEARELLDIQGKYNFSPAIITPQEFIKMSNYGDRELILERMQKDAEMIARQQQAQPPKIIPQGELQFNLSSKDPQTIFDTLQQMLLAQTIANQNNAQLQVAHANNGVNIAQHDPSLGGGPEAAPVPPVGGADNLSMGAMTQG